MRMWLSRKFVGGGILAAVLVFAVSVWGTGASGSRQMQIDMATQKLLAEPGSYDLSVGSAIERLRDQQRAERKPAMEAFDGGLRAYLVGDFAGAGELLGQAASDEYVAEFATAVLDEELNELLARCRAKAVAELCGECGGSGEADCAICSSSGQRACRKCRGQGVVQANRSRSRQGGVCADCGGFGVVKCDRCQAKGVVVCSCVGEDGWSGDLLDAESVEQMQQAIRRTRYMLAGGVDLWTKSGLRRAPKIAKSR